MSVSLSAWGHPDWGCPDHSDKVKDPNPNTPEGENPCGGNSYTYYHKRWITTKTVNWDWFYCAKSKKCIHRSGRCDMIPNPACTFRNNQTGETITEDEDGCDYTSEGLITNSATYKCQSRNHNEKSLAVLSTFFNQTGSSWEEGFQYNQTAIASGTIVNIRATRCDAIIECMDALDEKGCGMEVYESILVGKTLLTYIFCQDFFMHFLYM